MKKKTFFILTFLPFAFLSFACSSKPVEETFDSYEDVLPSDINDGVILHAFCWKYSDILSNLDSIVESGYRVVQTSPVTQPKKNGVKWDFFYQPVSYSISNDSPLGTKEELKELCTKAHEKGVSVIVDIVFNHMATTGEKDSDGFLVVDPEINNYEPYIYEHRNELFHRIKNPEGSGIVTMKYEGLPDIDTSNTYIQEKSYNLLKECIDVGVDGFRFDAAKHIETPEDPNYPSDFWPNTLGKAKEYYKEKNGKELFAYGEILNGLEGGRDNLSSYTKYMKITDNTYISGVQKGIISSKNGDIAAKAEYGKNTDATNLITWAESHDTYLHSSSNYKDITMARLWAIIASRKGNNPLYFARPSSTTEVGKIGSYTFEQEMIAVSNRFHNRFYNATEIQSGDKNFYINEKISDSDNGALIVDINALNKGTVSLKNIPSGTYWDSLTGKKVVVNNHKAQIEFDDSHICILTKTKKTPRPQINFSSRNESFAGTKEITIEVKNATSCTYSINSETPVSFTDKVTFTIGNNVINDNEVIVDITAKNDNYSIARRSIYTKFKTVEGYFNVFNLHSSYISDYSLYYWAWSGKSTGKWLNEYKYENGVLLIDFSSTSYTGFLLAIFPKDYKVSNLNAWDNNVIKQTTDITISTGFYDAMNF